MPKIDASEHERANVKRDDAERIAREDVAASGCSAMYDFVFKVRTLAEVPQGINFQQVWVQSGSEIDLAQLATDLQVRGVHGDEGRHTRDRKSSERLQG